VRALVDLVGGPQELHTVEVHSGRFPNLSHVVPNRLDFLQVTSHLVVELHETVGDRNFHLAPGTDHLDDVDGFHNALGVQDSVCHNSKPSLSLAESCKFIIFSTNDALEAPEAGAEDRKSNLSDVHASEGSKPS
jgi:hypothetical protein